MTMVQDVVAGPVGAVAPRGQALDPAPLAVPCAARPGSGLAHLDGPCQCFFGGPAPEFVGDLRPGWSRGRPTSPGPATGVASAVGSLGSAAWPTR